MLRPAVRPDPPVRGRPAHRAPGLRSVFNRSRGLRTAVTGVALSALIGSGYVVVQWLDDRSWSEGKLTLAAAEDTYVVDEDLSADRSGDSLLVTGTLDGRATTTYLKFQVPALPSGKGVDTATLEVSIAELTTPTVVLFSVPETDWSAADLPRTGAPPIGDLIAAGAPQSSWSGAVTVSFDVAGTVTGPGWYAFALRSPPMDESAMIFSREHRGAGPRLVLSLRDTTGDGPPQLAGPLAGPGTGQPGPNGQAGGAGLGEASPASGSPSGRASLSPAPGGNPSPAGSATAPAAPTKRPAAPPAAGILVGATLTINSGETWSQAYDRADAAYGPLHMIRTFYPGLPDGWGSGRAVSADRTVVVSFKGNARDIVAGNHDSHFANWFATAPRDRDIYWSYYHEPEDNIRDGEFTAAQYRDAWRRLAWLAEQANNPRLYATLVLMGWSVDSRSGRNWRDYYPGGDVIAVLGWDVYNLGRANGAYTDPEPLFRHVIETSRAEGKPWGVAEFGSQLVAGDESGQRRGAWIRANADHLSKHSYAPLWVAWFDSTVGGEFRLLDEPSRSAWHDFVRSQA